VSTSYDAKQAGAAPRVLIADDNQDTREMYALSLRRRRFSR